MKVSRVVGTTSEILQVFIQDSSSTTGAGLTSLTSSSLTLVAAYCRNDQAAATIITLVSMTAGSFSSGGFVAIDNTLLPGWYQFCPPNACFTSGRSVAINLRGAVNMAPLPIEVELTATNNQDNVRFGLLAIPNASAAGAGGLPIVGTGTNNFKSDGSANVTFANTSIGTASIVSNVVAVGTGAITAGSFAAGAIDATAIAANAIGASELAADAVTEIQSGLSVLTQADIRTAVGLGSANLDTQLSTIDDFLDTEIGSILSDVVLIKVQTDKFAFTVANQVDANVITKTGFALTSAYDFAKGTTAMVEAYAANGVAMTPVQALFAMHQYLMDFAITTTNYTVKKLDNSTTAFVVTLDDGTVPTAAART